jgi:hypothetical protein
MMGIDFIEIQFQLERRLQLLFIRGEFADFDLTAGGLEEIIWRKVQLGPPIERMRAAEMTSLAGPARIFNLRRATERPPEMMPISRDDCWRVVCEVLGDVLMIEPESIQRESHLINDLGME